MPALSARVYHHLGPPPHSRLNPLLKPLIEHNFIEIKTQGPKSTIILTLQGDKALVIFGLKKDQASSPYFSRILSS